MSTTKIKGKGPALTPQQANKVPSVKKVSPFAFSNTECKLKFDAYISNRDVPKTDPHNSLFFDLRNLPVSEEQLFEALKDEINGIAFRQESNFLEITLKNPSLAKTLLVEGITINEKLIIPLSPKETAPRTLRVKMANVPLHLPRKKLEQDITNHWAQYAIPPEVQALQAPVTWEYENATVLATWRGAPPSCLSCKTAGHYSSVCPTFPPKKTMAETLKKSISKNKTKPPKPVEHQTTTTIASSSKSNMTPSISQAGYNSQQFHTPLQQPQTYMSYAAITIAAPDTPTPLPKNQAKVYYPQLVLQGNKGSLPLSAP
ncbi:4201_t:CDS:2, partial [Paraglomus occultum]